MSEPRDRDAARRRFRWGRLVVALLWLALVALVLFGLARDVTLQRVADTIQGAGLRGALAFVLAFTAIQPLGLSAHIFILAAALIWPWWWAIPLSLIGALGSSVASWAIARYVAYDWVQARIPARLRPWESRLNSLRGVFLFRLITFTTPPAQLMMGTVQVRLPTLLLGTALGFLPMICADVFLGGELLSRLLG